MSVKAENVRSLLPEGQRKPFDDIVDQRVLGASKHISMIGEMFKSIAKACAENGGTTAAMAGDIRSVAAYFIATRGEASCAVTNAIRFMLRRLDDIHNMDVAEAARLITGEVENYDAEMETYLERLTDIAVEHLQGMEKILVFDYSSTVNRFLQKLGRAGGKHTVFIPESRIINGGYAYVETVLAAGLEAHFIPDSGMMFYLRQCQAALFGAETFYADGTAFNTVGADIVALVCKEYHVPLYVLTPMIKLDMRPLQGYVRAHVWNGLEKNAAEIGFTPAQTAKTCFACPELLDVNAEYIEGFITERGIIPPYGMFQQAVLYAEFLEGKEEAIC